MGTVGYLEIWDERMLMQRCRDVEALISEATTRYGAHVGRIKLLEAWATPWTPTDSEPLNP